MRHQEIRVRLGLWVHTTRGKSEAYVREEEWGSMGISELDSVCGRTGLGSRSKKTLGHWRQCLNDNAATNGLTTVGTVPQQCRQKWVGRSRGTLVSTACATKGALSTRNLHITNGECISSNSGETRNSDSLAHRPLCTIAESGASHVHDGHCCSTAHNNKFPPPGNRI